MTIQPMESKGEPRAARGPDDAVPFRFGDVFGEVAARFAPRHLEPEVRRLIDPATAEETVHWGRNYLYRTRLETPAGTLEVVVKQFRNQGLLPRLRRRLRGSKADRSWRMARAFEAAGLQTAPAVMLIESARADGPSFFVSRRLSGVVEARYLLRAVNRRAEAQEFPDVDVPAFLKALGRALRRMHEAGFFHRDLSIGNVLLKAGRARSPYDLYLIDLNRARRRRRLGISQRTRDLCRLAIFRPEHQRLFLDAYWGDGAAGWIRTALYRLYHHGFRFRIEAKKGLRQTTRRLVGWLAPRRPHAHIPEAPSTASVRDKIVWDPLSDQPHQHARRFEKLSVRVMDAPSHLRQSATFLASAPRIARRYRELRSALYRRPVPWGGVGVCVRPLPEAPDLLLQAIEDLGVDHVLLRLHPWEDGHAAEEALARELAGRGTELAFALPQNRDLVRDPGRWRRKVEELAERFTAYGRHFQIGQAINRSKWGIWRISEYLDLAESAAAILRRYPEVEVLGPAVIDFELHVTASVVNLRHTDLHFDVLSSLLYVDRRGAPERSQLGFDTVGKVVLAKAIADTARNCAPRSWVTEVNWPLWEGPHSPAGRTVSVDPETQADYLVRYYLLALATGAVERIYWWQLAARGYGLATLQAGAGTRPELVRRPGFHALATLARELRHSRFIRPLPSPPATHAYLFRDADGRQLVAAWSSAGRPAAQGSSTGRRVTLPEPAIEVVERDGERASLPGVREVEVSSSVRYFRL